MLKDLTETLAPLVGHEIQASIPDDVTGISSYTGTLLEVVRQGGSEGWAQPWLRMDCRGTEQLVNTAYLLSIHELRPRI